MSIELSRRSPSPYFNGSTYDIFEAIDVNNMKFEQLKQEVNDLFVSVEKKLVVKQEQLQKKIAELESSLGYVHSQIPHIYRELAKQRSSEAERYQQLTARIEQQDRIITAMGQQIDRIMRRMTTSSYVAPYQGSPFVYAYSQ